MTALFTLFKPGVSERTRQTACGVLTAVTLLAAIAYLMSGHASYGTLLAALTALLVITWGFQVLDRRDRARKDDKSTK